jgi:hypothetical protein
MLNSIVDAHRDKLPSSARAAFRVGLLVTIKDFDVLYRNYTTGAAGMANWRLYCTNYDARFNIE